MTRQSIFSSSTDNLYLPLLNPSFRHPDEHHWNPSHSTTIFLVNNGLGHQTWTENWSEPPSIIIERLLLMIACEIFHSFSHVNWYFFLLCFFSVISTCNLSISFPSSQFTQLGCFLQFFQYSFFYLYHFAWQWRSEKIMSRSLNSIIADCIHSRLPSLFVTIRCHSLKWKFIDNGEKEWLDQEMNKEERKLWMDGVTNDCDEWNKECWWMDVSDFQLDCVWMNGKFFFETMEMTYGGFYGNFW